MPNAKADIIAQLQKDILPLQGFKPLLGSNDLDLGLGKISRAFPNNSFPLGAVHEFVFSSKENAAATAGFVAGIIASLMKHNGTSIWISAAGKIFPPALKAFGIAAERIVFIDLKKEKEIQWVMEEALKCEGVNAVIAEMTALSFKASRRLQLAVETSKVTGFILHNDPQQVQSTACISRWQISALPSELENDLPGVGFPRWNVALQKIRNGRPGSWQVEFAGGRFRPVTQTPVRYQQQQKRTG